MALLLVPLALWAAMVLVWAGGYGGTTPAWRILLASAWLAAVAVVYVRLPLQRVLPAFAVLWVPVLLGFLLITPSNDRDWEAPSARTAHATFDGSEVTVHNVRNFRYAPGEPWVEAWEDRTYDLDALERAWFVLTEFGDIDGLAHVMVSFEFTDDRFLVLSVEIRREQGETYHPIGGAFRQYELYYVAADERDAIALRTQVHGDPTWVIPLHAGPEKTGEFFLDMVERMNGLHERPEWYNTLTSSCATNLARHYERVNDLRLGLDRRVFLPGFSDALLEELDLLPEGLDRAEVRRRFLVNERALADGNSEDFSVAIRRPALLQP